MPPYLGHDAPTFYTGIRRHGAVCQREIDFTLKLAERLYLAAEVLSILAEHGGRHMSNKTPDQFAAWLSRFEAVDNQEPGGMSVKCPPKLPRVLSPREAQALIERLTALAGPELVEHEYEHGDPVG